jgi:hypothetical protein
MNESDELVYILDILPWIDDTSNVSDPTDAGAIVDELIEFMLPKPLPQDRRDYFLNTIFLENNTPADWAAMWATYKGGGDEGSVRGMLEQLVGRLMQTPEYQLS